MGVLVTGGTGFVGSHLVRVLLERGEQVRCLTRRESRLDNLKELQVEFATGDLRDLDSLSKAVKGCKVVYHCAADYRLWCKHPADMYAANVKGSNNVMQAAFDEGVERVVYTSTVGCLGLNHNGTPANEDTPVMIEDMIGHYKRSKFLAEEIVRDWARRGLPVVIVNPSTPVGELDIKPTPTGKIIVDFLRGKMFGYVETGMNLIDVRDCAEGHVLAAEKGRVGERYILGGHNLTLKDMFDALASVTDIASPKMKVPHWVAETYARLENFWSIDIARREPDVPLESVKLARHKMWFDASKAVSELGLPQNPIGRALERAVNWFRDMAMSSLEQAPILVVAALSYELEKLNRAAHPGLVLLETGEGVANAERQLDAWLERRTARAVLSIGFAGALSAPLRVGDLVVAMSVHGSNAEPDPKLLAAAARVQLDAAVHFGLALTSERILWQASEKSALASSLGADEIGFVDMESTAIANVCARRGVPFLITRSITDLLEEDLPLDFNRCRDRDGRVSPAKVIKAALLKPGSFTGLLELRKRSEFCAERMAEFVCKLAQLIDPASPP